jgi:hypothetical protein
MPNVQSTIQLAVAASITGVPAVGSSQAALNLQPGVALTSGTGAGQAGIAWWTSSTLGASATETWDFAGTLRDLLNNLVTLARIKALIVSAAAGNTNNVVVGGGATTLATLFGATTHTTPVRPGGTVAWFVGSNDATGYVVTGGTADLLQIGNSGAGSTVGYTIAAIGCSA